MPENNDSELVNISNPGFAEKVTPKEDHSSLLLFKCTKALPVPEKKEAAPPEPPYPTNIEVDAPGGGGPYRTPPPEVPTCGNMHYRHAGYVTVFLPYMKPGQQKEVISENRQVMVCTKCKSCYVWDGAQMFDVTKDIDLNAWEKLEKEAIKATGPGGEC